MNNSKFSQVSTKKVIFVSKKIVSTTCQTRLNILSCTKHLKNRKNRKPRKSALKFSIGISALGLSAHICPTRRYVRPCISLNTWNWPLKLCGHILEYIYGWFMGKFFFRFFGPYKAGPCLKVRLNILSLALSWALRCCLCCTHVVFNRFKPPPKTPQCNNDNFNHKNPSVSKSSVTRTTIVHIEAWYIHLTIIEGIICTPAHGMIA